MSGLSWKTSELETVSCVLCGSDKVVSRLRRADGLFVNICACGLGYLSPRPASHVIERFYKEQYFGNGKPGIGYTSYVEESRMFIANPESTQNAALRKLGGLISLPGARILEVGAATGVFLAAAAAKGASVRGVEPNAEAAEVGRREFGVDIEVGYLKEVTLARGETFDAVVMLEVIEHPEDPLRMLRQARGYLKPGGILVISTPNFGVWRARKGSYAGLQRSLEHLYYWTRATMTSALEKESYTVLETTGLNPLYTQAKAGDGIPRRVTRHALGAVARLLPSHAFGTTLLMTAKRADPGKLRAQA